MVNQSSSRYILNWFNNAVVGIIEITNMYLIDCNDFNIYMIYKNSDELSWSNGD